MRDVIRNQIGRIKILQTRFAAVKDRIFKNFINNLFPIGIILSYILISSSSSLKLFFIAFGIFFIFSLVYCKNFQKALFLTAVFALPYSKGKNFFLIDDFHLILISPFTVCVLMLSIFSLAKISIFRSSKNDLFITAFFLWGVLSFIFANMQAQVLHYLFRLGTYILFYFLVKIYSHDEKIKNTSISILLTFIIFESTLSIIQFVVNRPLGMLAEEGIEYHPYGRLSDEDNALLRVSGTFDEPTYLARFLTILLPLLVLDFKKYFFGFDNLQFMLILEAIVAIFLSFTRFSWFVASTIIFVMLKKFKIRLSQIKKPFIILLTVILLCLGIRLYPYFEYKILVSGQSFQEFGSFDFRVKLVKESFVLISQYPLFGVGLRRFSEFAAINNITGIFNVVQDAKVHNVYLLIASEMGIPALIFFLGFVISSYYLYLNNRRKIIDKSVFMLKDAAAFGGLIYLLESMMGTIFLSPHLILFLLYMAMIVV